MATTRELLTTALEGGVPERTPLSMYSWMADDLTSDGWRRLIDQGLGLAHYCDTVRAVEHGVEDHVEEESAGGARRHVHTRVTPVGSVREVHVDGWQREWFVKSPADYRVLQWIVEHTELLPTHEEWEAAEEFVGDRGVVVVGGERTPAMKINLEWAGTERFCVDVALEVEEMFELYEAARRQFVQRAEMTALGPGRYVSWGENLTVSMVGPRRYRELLLPVYAQCVPIMERGGKRVMVHYDGALSAIVGEIGEGAFHMIESLTEPPEGDMTFDQCRAAWPDKVFWANLNLGCYALPPGELKRAVAEKRERAGKMGFAFEISEDLPGNWEMSVPVVLETLAELG